ncbi:unnamed protein product [Caretta caretta]
MDMDLAPVTCTFVNSKLDDCNRIYIGMGAGTFKRIQLLVSQHLVDVNGTINDKTHKIRGSSSEGSKLSTSVLNVKPTSSAGLFQKMVIYIHQRHPVIQVVGIKERLFTLSSFFAIVKSS